MNKRIVIPPTKLIIAHLRWNNPWKMSFPIFQILMYTWPSNPLSKHSLNVPSVRRTYSKSIKTNILVPEIPPYPTVRSGENHQFLPFSCYWEKDQPTPHSWKQWFGTPLFFLGLLNFPAKRASFDSSVFCFFFVFFCVCVW